MDQRDQQHLFDICAFMKNVAGFEYVSMVRTENALDSLPNDPRCRFFKPVNSVFASRIELVYDDDDGDNTAEQSKWAPGWYSFVESEQYCVDDYSMRGLLFLDFNQGSLADASDNRFRSGEWCSSSNADTRRAIPRWDRISADYAGIHVSPSASSNSLFYGWDVETVAVWNPACVSLALYVSNAGKPWVYDVGSSSSSIRTIQ